MDDSKHLFRVLVVANFSLYLGFEIWQGIFNNYAVEELGVRADQIGLIQSVREIPGLLGFVLAFLVLRLSELRVMGLSVLLLGIGLMIASQSTSLETLLLGTVVMSVGFHFFYPSNASVILMSSSKEETPRLLGRLRSVSAFAAVVATLLIWLLVKGVNWGPVQIAGWGYRRLWLVMGVVVTLGSLLTLRNGRLQVSRQQRRKIVFRRDYWLYYLLTFLMGSRRHIFSTFAAYLLVRTYGVDVRTMAGLFLLNSVIGTYAATELGKVVARVGERWALTINFAVLVGVFLGYAFVPYISVLFGLFVIDYITFGFDLAIDSYFQKISHGPEEITSNLSLAQTINHMLATVVPILGGLVWEKIGSAATFLAGVAIVLVSLVLVQFMHSKPGTTPAVIPVG